MRPEETLQSIPTAMAEEIGMARNEDLLTFRSRHFLPNAHHYHGEALQLVKARGEYVWDEQGRRYLDAIGGIVCISAGHNHPKIKKKLMQMLEDDEIQHTSLLYLSRHVTELGEALAAEAPHGLDRSRPSPTPVPRPMSSPFMAARQSTGETIIINLRHGYHGGTAGARWPSAATIPGATAPNPTLQVTPVPWSPTATVAPSTSKVDSCDLECAKNVETTIQTSTHGKIAGIIAGARHGGGWVYFDPPKLPILDAVTEIVHRIRRAHTYQMRSRPAPGRCGH